MAKYFLLLCFVLITAKNYSQELCMSYDISYKKDMAKINGNYVKTSESIINRVLEKDMDTTDVDKRKKRVGFGHTSDASYFINRLVN